MKKFLDSTLVRYHQATELYRDTYAYIIDAYEELKKPVPIEDRADVTYVLKQLSKYLNDLRKETDKLIEFSTKVTCLQWQDTMSGGPIRGQLCSASPSTKTGINLPKKSRNPEEWG